jgi:hypothetical protein
VHWAGPMNFGIETLGGCGHKLFPEHARHSNGEVDTPTIERNVDADICTAACNGSKSVEYSYWFRRKMLFHGNNISFERDCHSKGRLVRMAIDHSNGASILAREIKKAACWPPFFEANYSLRFS